MKRKIIFTLLSFLTILVSILSYYAYNNMNERKKLFLNKNTVLANYSVLEQQKKINQELNEISQKKEYTLKNAFIKQNPYEISPLSAIIIFQTEQSETIDVIINEEPMTQTEENTIHIIPIYGLLENFDNKIKIKSSKEEQEYTIKTEKSNLKPLEITKKTKQLNNDLYFMTASHESGFSAYDNKGNLRFYLTEMYRMDVEWLENGHFLIGIPEGQYAENFYAFVEMDYLGKIYNYYSLEHGFSFETQKLKNGNYLTAGGENPVYINKQSITEINPQNGETVKYINIYDIFKNIDPEFNDKYLGQAAIRNGFFLNEDTNDLIISFRGINTVFCLNYETNQLNWIFTDPKNELFQKDIWQKYLVKSTDNFYPWGQHAPIILENGNIAFFNNGYDRYHGFEVGGNDLVSDYKNNYSRAEIYEIKDKTSKRIWAYDASKKLFSHQYGSFIITSENTKLINFGWTLNDDFRNNPKAKLSVSEQNTDNTYAYLVELDENDKIIFEAKCEEGKYRIFKHYLYNPKTPNINLLSLQEHNSIQNEEVKISKITNKNLENAPLWSFDFKITKNVFNSSYELTKEDELELVFVNKKGDSYLMNYKNKKDTTINRIFSLNLPEDEYLVYVNLNNTLWKTNTIIKF